MANIIDLVNEFETVANAMVGIGSFAYGNTFELNEYRTQPRPLMVLHKQRALNYPDFQKKMRNYRLTIGIYSDYHEAEKLTTSYAQKQSDLTDLMEQYIRELRKRSLGNTAQVTSNQPWFMKSGNEDTVTVDLIEVIGNDKFIGIESILTFVIFAECGEGVFNY